MATQPRPEPTGLASRTTWTEHGGRPVYVVDYNELRTREEVVGLIWKSARAIQAEPLRSVRVLMLVRGVFFDQSVATAIREAGLQNQPHLKAVAVVGLTGLVKIIHRTMTLLMRQNMPVFEKEAEALDWLATQ